MITGVHIYVSDATAYASTAYLPIDETPVVERKTTIKHIAGQFLKRRKQVVYPLHIYCLNAYPLFPGSTR